MRISAQTLLILTLFTLIACNDGVIVFTTPSPAKMRVVNVTLDIPLVQVVVDSTIRINSYSGKASEYTDVAAGRPVGLQIASADSISKEKKYTFGDNGKTILFVKGSTERGVDFLSVQDTTLPANEQSSFVRFVHMAKGLNKASVVELWANNAQQVFPNRFQPELSSPGFARLPPGRYSFEVREARTPNVIARLDTTAMEPGRSYIIFLYRTPDNLNAASIAVF